ALEIAASRFLVENHGAKALLAGLEGWHLARRLFERAGGRCREGGENNGGEDSPQPGRVHSQREFRHGSLQALLPVPGHLRQAFGAGSNRYSHPIEPRIGLSNSPMVRKIRFGGLEALQTLGYQALEYEHKTYGRISD